jgi:uncharacterized Zn finger protein (UPF0148 family)
MFGNKCPHCGLELGNYLYADSCPHCHEALKQNLAEETPVHVKVARARSWPIRALFGIVRLVES